MDYLEDSKVICPKMYIGVFEEICKFSIKCGTHSYH